MSCFKHTMLALDYAAKVWGDPEINMAICLHDSGKQECSEKYGNAFGHEDMGIPYVESFCSQWKTPNSYKELALLATQYHTKIHGCMARGTNDWMRPKSILKLFDDTGAMKKPARFSKILKVCQADAKGRGCGMEQIKEFENKPYPQRPYLEECLKAVLSVDTKSISAMMLGQGKDGKLIGENIRVAKIDAIRGVKNKWMKTK